MQLVKWNPRREWLNLPGRFNRIFDEFFTPTLWNDQVLSMHEWNPVVDIYEDDDKIVVKAELPGVDKKDIVVDFEGRVLRLKGERSVQNDVKEDKFYRRERSFGKFERSFNLPMDVNPEQISAEYKDGVLKVEIPKPAHQKTRKITVN